MNQPKMAYFDEYCEKCKYSDQVEYEDPCNECLMNPMNIDSHVPVNFEEKD